MDRIIKMTISIDYIMLDRNFGKKFGNSSARPQRVKKAQNSEEKIGCFELFYIYLISLILQ